MKEDPGLPLDPVPWKCIGDSGRFEIGRTGIHTDCLKWKPRKRYAQKKKTYFKNDRWLTERMNDTTTRPQTAPEKED